MLDIFPEKHESSAYFAYVATTVITLGTVGACAYAFWKLPWWLALPASVVIVALGFWVVYFLVQVIISKEPKEPE
jgi:hypothetical protein